jgi:thiosulfate dehydrogenase
MTIDPTRQRPAPRSALPSFGTFAGGLFIFASVVLLAKAPPRDALPLTQYAPAPAMVAPPSAEARLIERGRDLIAKTSSTIGPDAADPAMRFAGNGLECASCHINAGTQPFGLSLVPTTRTFPRYIGRENETRTLAQRIDGCMVRSMNGRALPAGGPEMTAMLAYLASLAPPAPAPVKEESLAPLPLPDRAADPARGRQVFATTCAACHGADGLGQRLDAAEAAQAGQRYRFPPLWGPDSFNDGAGMARVVTAARFVHANMPAGVTWQSPVIAAEDAYDVMAFVDSQPRPQMAGLDQDYPNRLKKPADAGYAPFVGPFPADQHRFGPWGPIDAWIKAQAGTKAQSFGKPHSSKDG